MRLLITFIFIVSSLFVFAQPANNDCSNAIELTNLSNGCVTINNTGATYDNYVGTC